MEQSEGSNRKNKTELDVLFRKDQLIHAIVANVDKVNKVKSWLKA